MPPVESLAQRPHLADASVRQLAKRLPQPGEILLQQIDLHAMPGLGPLLVVVGPPQQAAKTSEREDPLADSRSNRM